MKGREFKKLREKFGTQVQVGRILGVSHATISRWEGLRQVPTLAEMAIKYHALIQESKRETREERPL